MSQTTQIRFYPPDYAAMLREHAGEKWRPSNGSEGMEFIGSWCGTCQLDKVQNGEVPADKAGKDDLCQIIGDTFIYDVEDHQYPKAWCINDDGQPCCTSYTPFGAPLVDTISGELFPETLA